MRQSLSSLTRWVVAGVLAGLATGAIAQTIYPQSSGFLDVNGTFSPIEVPGAASTTATGINNAGQIVGQFHFQDSTGFHGFLYAGGTFSTIDVPSDYPNPPAVFPLSINNTGHIVGLFLPHPFQSHGFVSANGTSTIFDVPGADRTTPTGINDAGQIVGIYVGRLEEAFDHGFLYAGGNFSTLPPAARYPFGINNAGQIVGQVFDSTGEHGFLYSGGTFSTFDVPGSDRTIATGINNTGSIVGTYFLATDPQRPHGFLYAGGTFTTIDVPGAFGTEANGINDAGYIVGTASVPEPGSLVLFSVGLLGVGLAWRRRVSAHLCQVAPRRLP